ncbi:MAG: transposase, partial [Planctomycetes bacterium]|nr:transposase [Planctomycetota bacterium]
PPKSPLRTAINYVNDNWPAFTRYTEQGYLNIDNNASERAIKSVVIGRKNWPFAGSEEGGKTSAIAYSMIESAKSFGANVWDWLL